MGTDTLTNMRDSVTFEMHSRTDLTNGSLDRWINAAYTHISMPNVFRHHELESTKTIAMITDDIDYSIAALNFWSVRQVSHFKGTSTAVTVARQRLEPMDITQFDDQGQLGTGAPSRWLIEGTQLFLDKRPTTNENTQLLQLRGYLIPTVLSATSDVTVLSRIWDEVIILGAVWRGLRGTNQPAEAEIAKLNYAEMIREVVQAHQLEAEVAGQAVDVVYGGQCYDTGGRG